MDCNALVVTSSLPSLTSPYLAAFPTTSFPAAFILLALNSGEPQGSALQLHNSLGGGPLGSSSFTYVLWISTTSNVFLQSGPLPDLLLFEYPKYVPTPASLLFLSLCLIPQISVELVPRLLLQLCYIN